MKLILYAAAIFCFLHAYRDYLQDKKVKNWFTEIGHWWKAPQYEKLSMVLFIIAGVVLLGAAVLHS